MCHLYGFFSSGQDTIKVEKDKYEDLLLSRGIFLETLFLEEKFDILMENYYDLEKEILTSSLRYLIFYGNLQNQMHDSRLSITRSLINLLTTCRLFLDQSNHHINLIAGAKSKIKEEYQNLKTHEYESNFSYRILEELRNHAQHKGYPFHIITFSTKLVDPEPGSLVVTSVIPKLSVKRLTGEGGFKQKVLDELSALGNDDIDLRPHIRSYIDSLQHIHNKIRKSTEDIVTSSINKLDMAYKLFSNENPDCELGTLSLIEFKNPSNTNPKYGDHFSYNSIKRYKELRNKNLANKSLVSQFVSSQIDLNSA
ncbi:MAG TPA: hypothetical protein ENF70_03215 [Deltaproteobacteria bacterium]|nr:hypothetical protein [Deltaproteobacteria bacterium]